MSRPPVFGWNAAKLSEHSFETLEQLRQSVMNEPASADPAHAAGKSIYIYTKAARAKLDALAWAVTHKLREQNKESA